ncbi:hypothetical protein AU377_06585 [Sporosarcina sp. HYO08]|nr:hypothetical protein AU377_06585 [Sporosarcina sp. HYO08]
MNHSLQTSQERFQSLLNHAEEIICILNREGNILFASAATEKILGYTADGHLGKNYAHLVHTDDLSLANRKLDNIMKRPNKTTEIELRLKHKNGEWRDFKISIKNLLHNASVNGIVCNLQDITRIKKQQREIHYMAYHDYLTELPNRRAFEERLNLEIRLANVDDRKFAVLFLNLDGFKYLNDSLGHKIGDLLLIEIARNLHRHCSQSIEMLARIDGDEFAILTTPLHDDKMIEKIAKEVLQFFEQSIQIKDYNLFITASIGIGIYPESGNDANTLIKNTDLALYLAEKKGSHHYQIFSPTTDIATHKIFSLRNDLQQALHNNEFIVHYQPIVHPVTNEIGSVEALLRWDHPKWGIVPPNEFIPLAEESGLIIPIGEWIIRTVCENLKEWHKKGYFIQASVNLSAAQFFNENLVDTIIQILEEHELDPKWLNVEITESVMLEQQENKIKKIAKLRTLGIQVSLDDFGTGYASYRSLKEIKPNIVKLDKSFVKELPNDQESVEIVTSIVQLAKKLSIIVVAEGVETAEQLAFLSNLQCDWVQGYLFSRPVSEDQLLTLLKGPSISENLVQNTTERRKYFRIEFQYPLECSMTISELNGKKVQLGRTNVLIENIGPGGLRFLSNIKLPAKEDLTLQFKMSILGNELVLHGKIIHTSEIDDVYRYGIQFILKEKRRELLIKKLNQFQLRLENSPVPADHLFVTDRVDHYFNKL